MKKKIDDRAKNRITESPYSASRGKFLMFVRAAKLMRAIIETVSFLCKIVPRIDRSL
jgi:hypothetical protein